MVQPHLSFGGRRSAPVAGGKCGDCENQLRCGCIAKMLKEPNKTLQDDEDADMNIEI